MSDSFEWGVVSDLRDKDRRLGKLEGRDIPALYMPWTQRVLNSFPLASSGGAWGDSVIPAYSRILGFYCSVYVSTTNNGTNYWTVYLNNTPGGVTAASFNTSGIANNVWTRFTITTGFTQPVSTDNHFEIALVATLSPGAIYIVPAVAIIRRGA